MRILLKCISKNEGLTLIEVLLAVAVMAIILGALSNYMLSFYNHWEDAQVNSKIIDDLNFVKSMLTRDIRSAVRPDNSTFPVVVDSTTNKNIGLYRLNENDNKMRNIEYSLNNNGELVRKMKESTNNSFPYSFGSDWDKTTVICTDLIIENIFEDINRESTAGDTEEEKDEADNYDPRFIRVNLTISREGQTEELNFEVMSRSRKD